MLVAIGQVDKELASELTSLLALGKDDKWDPRVDEGLTVRGEELRDKYGGDLYALLCSLTEGEAKSVVRSIVDKQFGQDGFKAFVDLNHRCD